MVQGRERKLEGNVEKGTGRRAEAGHLKARNNEAQELQEEIGHLEEQNNEAQRLQEDMGHLEERNIGAQSLDSLPSALLLKVACHLPCSDLPAFICCCKATAALAKDIYNALEEVDMTSLPYVTPGTVALLLNRLKDNQCLTSLRFRFLDFNLYKSGCILDSLSHHSHVTTPSPSADITSPSADITSPIADTTYPTAPQTFPPRPERYSEAVEKAVMDRFPVLVVQLLQSDRLLQQLLYGPEQSQRQGRRRTRLGSRPRPMDVLVHAWLLEQMLTQLGGGGGGRGEGSREGEREMGGKGEVGSERDRGEECRKESGGERGLGEGGDGGRGRGRGRGSGLKKLWLDCEVSAKFWPLYLPLLEGEIVAELCPVLQEYRVGCFYEHMEDGLPGLHHHDNLARDPFPIREKASVPLKLFQNCTLLRSLSHPLSFSAASLGMILGLPGPLALQQLRLTLPLRLDENSRAEGNLGPEGYSMTEEGPGRGTGTEAGTGTGTGSGSGRGTGSGTVEGACSSGAHNRCLTLVQALQALGCRLTSMKDLSITLVPCNQGSASAQLGFHQRRQHDRSTQPESPQQQQQQMDTSSHTCSLFLSADHDTRLLPEEIILCQALIQGMPSLESLTISVEACSAAREINSSFREQDSESTEEMQATPQSSLTGIYSILPHTLRHLHLKGLTHTDFPAVIEMPSSSFPAELETLHLSFVAWPWRHFGESRDADVKAFITSAGSVSKLKQCHVHTSHGLRATHSPSFYNFCLG